MFEAAYRNSGMLGIDENDEVKWTQDDTQKFVFDSSEGAELLYPTDLVANLHTFRIDGINVPSFPSFSTFTSSTSTCEILSLQIFANDAEYEHPLL